MIIFKDSLGTVKENVPNENWDFVDAGGSKKFTQLQNCNEFGRY